MTDATAIMRRLQLIFSGDAEMQPEDLLHLIPEAERAGDEDLIPLLEAMAAGELICMPVRRTVPAPLSKVASWQRPALLRLGDVDPGSTGPGGWIDIAKFLAWPKWIVIATLPIRAEMYSVLIRGSLVAERALLITCPPRQVQAWDRVIATHAHAASVTHALRPAGAIELPPHQRGTRH